MHYLLRAATFSGFNSLVRELGGEPERFLLAHSLPLDIEDRPDDFVPFRSAVATFEHAARDLDCPDFGLRLALRQGLPILGPLAVLARNMDNVGAAYESISRYLHRQTPAINLRLEPHLKQGFIRLHVSIVEAGIPHLRQALELVAGNGLVITQMLAGRNVFPLRVHFPHPRSAPATNYRRVFHCDVLFEADFCAMDIPLDIMHSPITRADPETARIATDYLAGEQGNAAADLGTLVKQLIQRLLPTGQCRIGVVADHLCLHPRTLQRRLNEEGHHFEELVDAERRHRLQQYLAEPQLRLAQIAGMLGYADQSVMNRSCKRWFDCTPRELRKTLAGKIQASSIRPAAPRSSESSAPAGSGG